MPATQRHIRAPETHPRLMQTVELTLRPTTGSAVLLRTKVLDTETTPEGETTIVVACPEGWDPLEHHFDASVVWTYPLGQMECAVTTRPATRPYGRVWLLTPCGPLTRLQKREFFRAGLSVPVLMTWSDAPGSHDAPDDVDVSGDAEPSEPPEPHLVAGSVVDISEGGLLAAVRGDAPAVGTEVESAMRIDGEEITHKATVVRHVSFVGGGTGIAIAFEDPTEHGDRLRRIAFEAERRRRREA